MTGAGSLTLTISLTGCRPRHVQNLTGAREITVRDSMVYLDGADYTGMGPGLRTESTDKLMVTYLTDIRGERVLILQASWFG